MSMLPILKTKTKVACTRCRRSKVKCSGGCPCDKCAKYNLECKYPKTEVKERMTLSPGKLNNSDNILSIAQEGSNANETNNMPFRLKDDKDSPRFQKYTLSKNISTSYWRYTHRFQNVLYLNFYKYNLNKLPQEMQKHVREPRIQFYGWNMSGLQYVELSVMPKKPEFDFVKIHESLVKYYLDKINPLLGIMNINFLLYLLLRDHSIMETNLEVPVKLHKEDTLLLAMLHLIYSISIRFIEFEKVDGPDKHMLKVEKSSFEFAYHLLRSLSFDIVSLELIRAWLLVTFYLRVCHTQRSCMAALDQANCMARSMGLHLSEMSELQEKKLGKIDAKKVFWCLYTFDQLYSIQIGREAFWSRKENITVDIPTRDDTSKSDECFPLPFYGMLKLSLLAKDISEMHVDGLIFENKTIVIQKLDKMYQWLFSNGFFDNGDPLNAIGNKNESFFREQVLLQFYDISFCFYGPFLQSYVTKDFSSAFVEVEGIIQCWNGVLHIFKAFKKDLILKRPWPLNIMLIFCVGITSLVMVNKELSAARATESYKQAIELLSFLANESVPSNQFPMAIEALLALNQCSKLVQMKINEDLESMKMINVGLGDEILRKRIHELKENSEASLPYEKVKISKANESPCFQSNSANEEILEDYHNIFNEIDWFGEISEGNLFIEYDFL